MLRIEEKDGVHHFRHEAMATDLTVSLGGVEPSYARQAGQEIFARVDDVERKLSLYREDSDVSRINLARSGDVLRVSEDCVNCLEAAMRASALTGDRFHAFLGADSLRRKGGVPNFLTGALESMSSGAGLDPAIELDSSGRVLRKARDGALLDLGGIGKGYALDVSVEILDDWEIPFALLNFGGSTLLFHAADAGLAWTGTLSGHRLRPLANVALSSSGVGYQGEHISHPRGDSVGAKWIRSYSRAPTAALADALSTAAMLMDAEELEGVVERDPGLAFALEDEEGVRLGAGFCEGGEH